MALKKQLREHCMQRDGRCCRKCALYFPKKGLQLHHVVPQRLNGPDAYFNLVCLCGDCHTEWHSHEAKIGATWDPRKAKEEFFQWLRSDDPVEDARELNDQLNIHFEEQLRELIFSLTWRRKRRKLPRNIRQTTHH